MCERVRNVNQVSFKPGPENCYGRCGSDKIWQTVPDTCGGDRENSVTNRACGRSVSGAENGAERAKSAAQIRSHQHCVDLAISAAFYYSINI